MGVGWRRFTERLHQGTPIGSKGFQATSNARCATMLKEATAFTQQLKKCLKAVSNIEAVNVESVSSIKSVMVAPLPRVYEETAVAGGGGVAGMRAIGGDAFSAEAVSRAMQEAGHKVETEVLAPLTRWQDVYNQLSIRYRELEDVRLEVDSRRRTVEELSHKVDGMRARLGSGGNAKNEGNLEQSIMRLQHKEGKLQVATQTYVELEKLLHRDLSTLVRDAQWLKHYVAAALNLQGNAMLASAAAFGDLPAPSPPAGALRVAAPPVTRLPPDIPRSLSSPAPPTPAAQLEVPMARYPVTEARQGDSTFPHL